MDTEISTQVNDCASQAAMTVTMVKVHWAQLICCQLPMNCKQMSPWAVEYLVPLHLYFVDVAKAPVFLNGFKSAGLL